MKQAQQTQIVPLVMYGQDKATGLRVELELRKVKVDAGAFEALRPPCHPELLGDVFWNQPVVIKCPFCAQMYVLEYHEKNLIEKNGT